MLIATGAFDSCAAARYLVPDTLDILPQPGTLCHIEETYTGEGIFATVYLVATLIAVEDAPPNSLRPRKPREARPLLSRRGEARRLSGPEGVPMRAAFFDASGRTLAGIRWTGSATLSLGKSPWVPYFMRLERDRAGPQAPGLFFP